MAGLLTGLLAIGTGLLEYVEPSVVGVDMRLASRHGVRTTLAWFTFNTKMLFVMAVSPIAAWSLTVCLLLDLLGCILLVQGVYFGAKQVYQQIDKH